MRKHRGLSPDDHIFFNSLKLKQLQKAVCDLSWLLSRKYPLKSSVNLVGNHYQLTKRERLALAYAATDGKPHKTSLSPNLMKEKSICIDGFNLLITLESALDGGIILYAMDGCYRDISNVHASYKLGFQTEKAIELTADAIKELKIKDAIWIFDKPVSNSGRVANIVNSIAKKIAIPMSAKTLDQVDTRLKNCNKIVVTCDSVILSSNVEWFNLAEWIIKHHIPNAKIINLQSQCKE